MALCRRDECTFTSRQPGRQGAGGERESVYGKITLVHALDACASAALVSEDQLTLPGEEGSGIRSNNLPTVFVSLSHQERDSVPPTGGAVDCK